MALKAKSSEFRRKVAAAGTIRTRGTMSSEKAALQKFADWSPNAFLRWVLIQSYHRDKISQYQPGRVFWYSKNMRLTPDKKLHSKEHLLADDLSGMMGEPKKFAAYLGIAELYYERDLRALGRRVLEKEDLPVEARGKYFFAALKGLLKKPGAKLKRGRKKKKNRAGATRSRGGANSKSGKASAAGKNPRA